MAELTVAEFLDKYLDSEDDSMTADLAEFEVDYPKDGTETNSYEMWMEIISDY